MEEKTKKNKRAYLNDFKLNESGNYIYKGIVYEWNEEAGPYSTARIKLCACGVLMLGALILEGCVDTQATINCMYVIVPYVAGLILGVSTLWGIGRFAAAGNPLRSYIYDGTVVQIPGMAAAAMACQVLAFAGQIVYLMQNGFENKAVGAVLFLLLNAAVFGLGFLIRKQIAHMKWVPRV